MRSTGWKASRRNELENYREVFEYDNGFCNCGGTGELPSGLQRLDRASIAAACTTCIFA